MQQDILKHIDMESSAQDMSLSIIVPVYNEQEVLPTFHQRLYLVLDSMAMSAEIIYVNDGSTDETITVIQRLQESDPRIAFVDLSRNFGKEIALTSGLDYANGNAVIVIDADLQDPPELIPELVKHWLAGYDVVYAKRMSRTGESVVKKTTSYMFYRVIQRISRVPIPEDTGDYRLLSRRAVHALRQIHEQHRFMKGLFTWIGYPQKAVPYQRNPRYAGQTKWNYWKLWNFALEGITSFTIAPLKIASYVGLVVAITAFGYAGVVIYETLVYGNPVAGYPSLLVVILFLGGVQLVAIGIVGEYLGRIFDECKQRPLYFLKGYSPARKNEMGNPLALPEGSQSSGCAPKERELTSGRPAAFPGK